MIDYTIYYFLPSGSPALKGRPNGIIFVLLLMDEPTVKRAVSFFDGMMPVLTRGTTDREGKFFVLASDYQPFLHRVPQ